MISSTQLRTSGRAFPFIWRINCYFGVTQLWEGNTDETDFQSRCLTVHIPTPARKWSHCLKRHRLPATREYYFWAHMEAGENRNSETCWTWWLRHAFNRNSGSYGEASCVQWMLLLSSVLSSESTIRHSVRRGATPGHGLDICAEDGPRPEAPCMHTCRILARIKAPLSARLMLHALNSC